MAWQVDNFSLTNSRHAGFVMAMRLCGIVTRKSSISHTEGFPGT